MNKSVNDIFIRLEYKDNRNTSQADIPAFVSKTLHVRSKPATHSSYPIAHRHNAEH